MFKHKTIRLDKNGLISLIKETVNDILLSESRMRVWDYYLKLKEISKEIDDNKRFIIDSSQWYTYKVNNDTSIIVGNKDIFNRDYPAQRNSGGFMMDGNVIFYIRPDFTFNIILTTIMHELEHTIDYQPKNKNRIVNPNQVNQQIIAYSGVYDPQNKNDEVLQNLETYVKNIMYRLWINTEKNAFVAQIINGNQNIDNYIEDLATQIKYVQNTDANFYSDFWKQVEYIYLHRKTGSNRAFNAEKIKNHFVHESFHKLKQYEKNLQKKLMYAKMNGIETNSRIKTIYPPIQNIQPIYYIYTTEQLGPYTLEEITDLIGNGVIQSNTWVWKNGLENWEKAYSFPELKNYLVEM